MVSTDKRSGITNDPNRPDEPDYILRLIKRVTYVSVETVKIVREIETIALDSDAVIPANAGIQATIDR